MALFVRQDQERSQLQEKLAAELKHKLASKQIKAADTSPALLDGDHPTRKAGIIIILLVLLVVITGIVLIAVK